MFLHVMYSNHNQSSSDVNEHTTPKTVTIFAVYSVEAKTFDIKVRVRKCMVHLAFANHHNVQETFENKGLQLEKLETSYTVDVLCPIFKFCA